MESFAEQVSFERGLELLKSAGVLRRDGRRFQSSLTQ